MAIDKKKKIIAGAVAGCVIIGGVAYHQNVYVPNRTYQEAIALYDSEKMEEAKPLFEGLGEDYKESKTYLENIAREEKYQKAVGFYNMDKLEDAKPVLEEVGEDYKDVSSYLENIAREEQYRKAMGLYEEEKLEEAKPLFEELGEDYKETGDYLNGISVEEAYQQAEALLKEEKYEEAEAIFNEHPDYKETADHLSEIAREYRYREAAALLEEGKIEEAKPIFEELEDYREAKDKLVLIGKEEVYREALQSYETGDYVTAAEKLTALDDYKDASDIVSSMEEKKESNASLAALRSLAFYVKQSEAKADTIIHGVTEAVNNNTAEIDTNPVLDKYLSSSEYKNAVKAAAELLSKIEAAQEKTEGITLPALEEEKAKASEMAEAAKELLNYAVSFGEKQANNPGKIKEKKAALASAIEAVEAALPEKNHILLTEDDLFDFRHVSMGMTEEEACEMELEEDGTECSVSGNEISCGTIALSDSLEAELSYFLNEYGEVADIMLKFPKETTFEELNVILTEVFGDRWDGGYFIQSRREGYALAVRMVQEASNTILELYPISEEMHEKALEENVIIDLD